MAGVEAQVVEYQLKWPGGGSPFSVTVWINPKTHLPLKRVLTGKHGADNIVVTETFTKTVLDGKIDEKQFVLPE